MASCYYHLGQFEMAEACFKRTLQIDSKCVDSILGLAVISEKREDMSNYINYLQIAREIEPEHSLLILLLAEHYLYAKQYKLAKSYA